MSWGSKIADRFAKKSKPMIFDAPINLYKFLDSSTPSMKKIRDVLQERKVATLNYFKVFFWSILLYLG